MGVSKAEKEQVAPPPPAITVAVGLSGKRNSKLALKWALDNFLSDGRRILFKLLYVRPKIDSIPSPMGQLPIEAVRKDVATAYLVEMESMQNEMLVPYERMCAERNVEAETLIIEAEDVADAISTTVTRFDISKLVIGGSARNTISKKFINNESSNRGIGLDPHFCLVYFVSKGKLSSVHTASLDVDHGPEEQLKRNNLLIKSRSVANYNMPEGSSTPQRQAYSDVGGWNSNGHSGASTLLYASSLVDQRCQALSTVNAYTGGHKLSIGTPKQGFSSSTLEDLIFTGSGRVETASSSSSGREHISDLSNKSFQTEGKSWVSESASYSDVAGHSNVSNGQITDELEKLKIELRHVQEMFKMAQDEREDTSRQVAELSSLKMKELNRLKMMSTKEEKARELIKYEKEKREVAEKEAEFAKECLERELVQRKAAEIIAAHEAKEKHKLENTLFYLDHRFEKFDWDEIESATSSFSASLKIGEGAYGSVYKCTMRHITCAVKVLQQVEVHKNKQFQRELEILSKIRHPHLLLLIGACPDRGCLVYEYMENGSLDDRLSKKNNTPSIPWYDRFRICWEVASALLFLHSSKPKPIVHRDLKPANILLDHNLISKIGDVGLCTLIPNEMNTMATVYKHTVLVGTYCYVDPEYQRTGFVSPKSDLYAYGIVVLQLLTAKSPMGLAHFVETAIEEGRLEQILDTSAGKWPIKEAQELAVLGLRCAEFRHKDRPDLKNELLPLLIRLKEMGDIEKVQAPNNVPPTHFLCPILQDVMEDPWVASDGYTYERRAIERWLSTNETSPMTNLPMPNKFLIPNHTLSSAIAEWKSKVT